IHCLFTELGYIPRSAFFLSSDKKKKKSEIVKTQPFRVKFYTMKVIIQRVAKASITVGDEQISSIGRGLCVLLGISLEDTQKDVEYMVRKILNLRLFEDENGKHWCKSVMDKQYEVLCVSQFTLLCTLKGNKPDYHMAMPAEQSEPFYKDFLEQLRKTYKPELIKALDDVRGPSVKIKTLHNAPV
uniref:D-aminoacyl-tRNA deacylase n=1 Tax=Latimeria chalumnae TaxID=7897 RepID=H3ACJ5_LATCH